MNDFVTKDNPTSIHERATSMVLEGETYVHIKSGKAYTVVRVSLMEQTHEALVTYERAPHDMAWTRPLSVFLQRFRQA